VVERDLAKVDVAGSTPVSRSRFFKGRLGWRFLLVPTKRADGLRWTFCAHHAKLAFRARYPSGKGEVCKTFTREFDSHPRLHLKAPVTLRVSFYPTIVQETDRTKSLEISKS
jgi:hypothetical protein